MPSKPLILGFDTSAAHCAAALLWGDDVIAKDFKQMRKGQAESLFPIIDDLLEKAQLKYADISAIAVGVGPGNFTGIRISVSAARGLALALKIPVIGVTGFAALGYGADHRAICTIPAAAGRFYLGWAGKDTPQADLVLWDGNNFDIPAGAQIRHWPDDPLPEIPGITYVPQQMNIAEAIARQAARVGWDDAAWEKPAPYYLKPADAAPPKQPPVVILDA